MNLVIVYTPELLKTIITHLNGLLRDDLRHHQFHEFKVFAGLLPKTWTEILVQDHQYLSSNKSTYWLRKIGRWFIQKGHDLWLMRNQTIHKTEDKETHIDEVLNQKIRNLYSLQADIGYHDRSIFDQPLEDRLTLPHHQKMTWISQTTRTMKVSMEEFKNKQTTGQRDIREFFQKCTQSP